MIEILRNGLLLLLTFSVIMGCVKQGPRNKAASQAASTNKPTQVRAETILWGAETERSLFLDPIAYQRQDPLGKLRQEWRIERLSGKMINIPSGSYRMGSDNGDSDEKPVHSVSIKAFKLGKTEVTQRQWWEVTGKLPSYFKNCDDCPVERVSWNDAQDFIRQLNRKTPGGFRLPSESEWEYACRSGGKNQTNCGGNNVDSLSWYDQNSDSKTHAVGGKRPNQLGLYDMSGNVWEWVEDCHQDSYASAPSNSVARSTGDCTRRVLRGGSWSNSAGFLRSSLRIWHPATNLYYDSGFRLAQD